MTKMDERQNSEVKDGSTFEALLSYLLQEKRVMKYMENDVRGCNTSSAIQINQATTKMNAQEINESVDEFETISYTEPSTSDVKQICLQIQTMDGWMVDDLFVLSAEYAGGRH